MISLELASLTELMKRTSGSHAVKIGLIDGPVVTQHPHPASEHLREVPLAGFDFRLFPLRRHNFLEIEGGMRGMDFGSYGYYVQAIAQGGVCMGPFTILAGYRAVDTSIVVTSNSGSANGLTARLQGPIFSGMFRR